MQPEFFQCLIWLDRSNKYDIVLEPGILANHPKYLKRLILAQHGQNFHTNSGRQSITIGV
jgi:hypothetical protein